MSTILKALRRLERERTQKGRPLREQVTGSGGGYRGDARAPRRWPILLVGVGAGVAAGLAVLQLVLSRGEPVPQAAPEAAEPPAAATTAVPAQNAPGLPAGVHARTISPAERAARERRLAAAQQAAPPSEPLEDVAVLDRGSPEPRVVAEVELPPDPNAPPKPGSLRPLQHADPRALPGAHLPPGSAEPAGPPGVAASAQAVAPAMPPEPDVERAAPPEPPVERSPEPPRAEPPARAPAVKAAPAPAPAKRAPARTATAPAKVPGAPAVPFPSLRVERTSWHPLAERRVAVIALPDGKTQSVHEGDNVSGAVVKRIEPSGVVFEQAGREVRRKVGAGGRS